jgi:5-methyltetrahydrofolate--homocysteine methyltransferase
MRILDGAYGTLLAAHLASDESADDLCVRDPRLVIDAHRAYLEAGATGIRTNAGQAWRRDSTRRRTGLQLAALDCAREAIELHGGPAAIELAATIGPAGIEPRDYWRDLELLLDAEVAVVQVEHLARVEELAAALAAWDEVARGVDGVSLMLGITVAQGRGEAAARPLLDAAGDAPEGVRVGLRCCEGAAGLRPYLERLYEQRGASTWLAPGAGADLEEPAHWAQSVHELSDGFDLDAVGGCCGTTPTYHQELVETLGS